MIGGWDLWKIIEGTGLGVGLKFLVKIRVGGGKGGVILIGAKPSFLLVMDGFCSYNTVYLRSLSHEMLIFLLTVFDTWVFGIRAQFSVTSKKVAYEKSCNII